MKRIMLDLQTALATVPGLNHIDRDWGQLRYDQPPVLFPCALVDVRTVEFTELLRGHGLARVTGTVTVADQVLVRSSAQAPSVTNAYALVDLVWQVYDTLLHLAGRTPGDGYQPLTIERVSHDYADRSYDVFTLEFSTAFRC